MYVTHYVGVVVVVCIIFISTYILEPPVDAGFANSSFLSDGVFDPRAERPAARDRWEPRDYRILPIITRYYWTVLLTIVFNNKFYGFWHY